MRESFSVSLVSRVPKILCFRGLFHDFRFFVEIFLSHSAEKFRRETLACVILFGYRKFLCYRGLCHDFPSKIFCLKVPKNFVGEPFGAVVQKHSGGEKVYG